METLLGFDLGSSSVKVSVIDSETTEVLASATMPKEEMKIVSTQKGYAEQEPSVWWKHAKECCIEISKKSPEAMKAVCGVGISYQMHGLVLLDEKSEALRPAIIWCDSRAAEIGKKAFLDIGQEKCLSHLLNSPGNFTASKLSWVKQNEEEVYNKIKTAFLPGDYLAYKLSGEKTTTFSGLSEATLWDFSENRKADFLLDYYGIDTSLFPNAHESFHVSGIVSKEASEETGIPAGVKIAYRGGDQPNNALSLGVLSPGEIAATAGTSGVVYGISDKVNYDSKSRVNTFLHVNHAKSSPRYGILLCVNGTGRLNSWLRSVFGNLSYEEMNNEAALSAVGANSLVFLPFGNGAERILENRDVGASMLNLRLNNHNRQDILRAAQEGIVFALNYGMEIMKEMGTSIKNIRAGKANMFLSGVFKETFASVTGATVELYDTDGSKGAAIGAGVGARVYSSAKEGCSRIKLIGKTEPSFSDKYAYEDAYGKWKEELEKCLKC